MAPEEEEEEGGLTFSLEVGSHGAKVLRDNILKKLSEFMGSYTDDVLAEYVVVLVSHGKQRAQAIKDLEAFLGDRSEFFVTWLWEHLGSNMHLYTSSPPDNLSPNHDNTGNDIHGRNEDAMKRTDAPDQVKDKSHVARVEGGRIISLRSKPSENHSRRELSLNSARAQSSVTRGLSGSIRAAKRQRSPDSRLHSERVVSDQQKAPRVNASMRLLQSAVRDAVAPATGHPKRPLREAVAAGREATASLQPSILRAGGHSRQSESTFKRLQSVVSADFENSEVASVQQPLKDTSRPKATRQSQRAMPAIMMAVKAAAAAAEDVAKVRARHTGNIWDRLGKKSSDSADSQEEEYQRYQEDSEEALEERYFSHDKKHNFKRPRLDHDEMLSEHSAEDDPAVSDSGFDKYHGQTASSRHACSVQDNNYHESEKNDEGFMSEDEVEEGEDTRARDRRRRSREESVTVEYRLARKMEGAKKELHKQKSSSTTSGLANSSQKIVNISVNVNTWKPGAYDTSGASEQPAALPSQSQSQEQAEKAYAANTPSGIDLQDDSSGISHLSTRQPARELQQEATNQFSKPVEATKDVAKPTLSAVPPTGIKLTRKLDDAESRTVFVTNIHFAASKESVTAHFASCGEIGRIVMLTDGATGQPKGSAYIEFKTKDATDRALALNESSFYSRALKVVRKDAAIQAIQEMNPLIHPALIRRPIPIALRLPPGARILRAPPYLVQRRYPPAIPRPYGNFPSLQWKRDGISSAMGNVRAGFSVPVRPVRSHSYVRSSVPQLPKPGDEAIPQQDEKGETKMDVNDVPMDQA